MSAAERANEANEWAMQAKGPVLTSRFMNVLNLSGLTDTVERINGAFVGHSP